MKINKNMDLTLLSGLKIGGSAEIVYYPENKKELIELIAKFGADAVIIGGGTNTVFSSGVHKKPFIVTAALNEIRSLGNCLYLQSGVLTTQAVDTALRSGLKGMECLWGIPGTIGGAIKGNASIGGGSLFSNLKELSLIGLDGGEYQMDKFTPGYRDSGIKDVIFSAEFELDNWSGSASAAVIEEMKAIRAAQPKGISCGSIFKNPEGKPAGYLIDKAGFKGRSWRGLTVSKEHANWFIRTGDAVFEDFENGVSGIRKEVLALFDIELELEIKVYYA